MFLVEGSGKLFSLRNKNTLILLATWGLDNSLINRRWLCTFTHVTYLHSLSHLAVVIEYWLFRGLLDDSISFLVSLELVKDNLPHTIIYLRNPYIIREQTKTCKWWLCRLLGGPQEVWCLRLYVAGGSPVTELYTLWQITSEQTVTESLPEQCFCYHSCCFVEIVKTQRLSMQL